MFALAPLVYQDDSVPSDEAILADYRTTYLHSVPLATQSHADLLKLREKLEFIDTRDHDLRVHHRPKVGLKGDWQGFSAVIIAVDFRNDVDAVEFALLFSAQPISQ